MSEPATKTAPPAPLVDIISRSNSHGDAVRSLTEWVGELTLVDRTEADRAHALLHLLQERPAAYSAVKHVLAVVDHAAAADSPDEAIVRWTACFDRAAAISPEASVAAYSLGCPELLRAATAEIVAWMRANGLLAPSHAVLDLGCGIGRLMEALASEVARVVGIDISPRMIALAAQRCAGHANVDVLRGAGRDLGAFPDRSFDLICAVDVFPYLVKSGGDLAGTHIREAARLLRKKGSLLIFNYAYGGNLDCDRAEVARFADEAGFDMLASGASVLQHWDARLFHLQRRT